MNKIVRIRPNTKQDGVDNFGLEQYGEVMMPGVKHIYSVAYIEQVGSDVIKYVTGLDETHPSVLFLPEEERIKKIKHIRKEASEIYYSLEFKKVDPEDPHFWEKCSLLAPTNVAFWKEVILEIDNLGRVLNLSNVKDRILYNVIKAGGIPEVAPSQSIGATDYVRYKFYLDDGTETPISIQSKKSKTQAYSILGKYLESSSDSITNRMGYLCKILIPSNYRYAVDVISDSEKDVYFQMLENYLSGNLGVHSDAAIDNFIKMYDYPQQVLATASLIQELVDEQEAIILDDRSYFIKRGDIKLTNDLLESARLLCSNAYFKKKFKDLVVYYSSKKKLVVEDLLQGGLDKEDVEITSSVTNDGSSLSSNNNVDTNSSFVIEGDKDVSSGDVDSIIFSNDESHIGKSRGKKSKT